MMIVADLTQFKEWSNLHKKCDFKTLLKKSNFSINILKSKSIIEINKYFIRIN